MPRIDLGTAVRVRVVGRDQSMRRVQGVVVEVVRPCCESRMVVTEPARHVRYVVQCERFQVLARPRDLLIDAW